MSINTMMAKNTFWVKNSSRFSLDASTHVLCLKSNSSPFSVETIHMINTEFQPKPWKNISLNLNIVPKSHSCSRQLKNTISIEHINLYWIIYDSTIVPIHSIIQFFLWKHANLLLLFQNHKQFHLMSFPSERERIWYYFQCHIALNSWYHCCKLMWRGSTSANSQFVHWHWRINNSLYCDCWNTYITKFQVEFRVSVIFACLVYT